MENLSRTLLNALLLCALAVWGSGCDDSTPGGGGDPDEGAGGAGGDAMVEQDTGGGGNKPETCFDDTGCADSDYCDLSAGNATGTCEEGCRLDPDNCEAGQHCDASHECVDDPCMADADCPDAQYCRNPGAEGECVDGCRDGGECPLAGSGHDQACDTAADPHECVPLIPCCADDGSCTATVSCEGTPSAAALSCDGLACDRFCPGGDADCDAASQFCNDDGICQDGCQEGVDEACPPDEVCNDKHECEPRPCDEDNPCPDGHYCDDDGTCHQGECGDDAQCEGDDQCIDNVCQGPDCDEVDNPCPDGQFCNAGGNCQDDCQDDADCDPGEFCSDEGPCAVGCRDDSWEDNDDIGIFEGDDADSFFLDLPAAGADGFRRLLVDSDNDEPTKICSDPPEMVGADFYGVTVPQVNRMRVELSFDANLGNLNLRLHGAEVGEDPIASDGLDNPESIEFPPLNDDRNEADYYIEVYGDVGEEVPYELLVIVGPGACFPDGLEPNDGPDEATEIGSPYANAALRVCAGDEDWFVMELGQNDGLEIEVCTAPGSGDVEIAVYEQDKIDRADFGNPNFRSGAGEDREGETCYRIQEAENGNIDVAGSWYIRVEGGNNDDQADYRISVTRLGGDECPDEAGELQGAAGNNEIAGALDLGDIDPDEEQAIPGERALCPANDVDWFCFPAEESDALEAWLDCDGVVGGSASIRITDEGGNLQGGAGSCGGAADSRARAVAGGDGTYCIQVAGVGVAQGPYVLNVLREPVGEGLCAVDDDEPPRNDTAASATEMAAVPGHDNTRFEHNSGVMCDPGDEDVDWYSFPVASARSSVCVMLDRFDNDRANLDLEVFRDAAVDGGMMCPCAEGLECVRGRCSAPRAGGEASSRYDVERVFLSRGVVGADSGDHLARVYRGGDGADQSYTIIASIIPDPAGPGEACPDDIHEPNDDAPEQLGDGEKALCDMWICEAPDRDSPRDVDTYEITVPGGQDRTVLIEFGVEGRLFMYTEVPPPDPDDIFSGLRLSEANAGQFQCINVRASGTPQAVTVRVEPNLISDDDNNNRVDYTLRVVDTDLEANASGACELLGGPPNGACPDDDPYDFAGTGCWQTAILPD